MMGTVNDHTGKHAQVTKVSEPDYDLIVFLSDLLDPDSPLSKLPEIPKTSTFSSRALKFDFSLFCPLSFRRVLSLSKKTIKKHTMCYVVQTE